MAQVTLLYFAWLRERIGTGEQQMELPPGIDRVDRVIAWLAGLSPGHAAAFAQPEKLRCAVNQALAGLDAAIGPGDEIAFFPPITGG